MPCAKHHHLLRGGPSPAFQPYFAKYDDPDDQNWESHFAWNVALLSGQVDGKPDAEHREGEKLLAHVVQQNCEYIMRAEMVALPFKY